jgi:nitroreductase
LLEELIKKNRSYRRFHGDKTIKEEEIKSLINLARLSASAANKQPLKYIISNNKKMNSKIFPNLSWAGYLKDWTGPQKGERPTAYILMLGDKEISTNYWSDPGIAAQSILLGATEEGLGGCILGAVDKKNLRKELNIDERYEILYVLALGEPKEKVVLEELKPNGNIKYWKDDQKTHHVPKRKLEDIILK